MRVLFLTRSLHLGGAESQLVALAQGLSERGHEVAIATFYAGGQLWNDARAKGLLCRDLGKRSRWDLIRTTRRLAALTREFKPDVAYSFLQGANITLGLARPLLECRVVAWGVRASNMVFGFYGREARFILRAECWFSRLADAVICNSASGAAFYADHGVAAQRLHVIENGIDGGQFTPDPDAAAELRTQLGIRSGAHVVGVVGRIDPVKDHATALAACGNLVAQGRNLDLWIVGDGPAPLVASLKAQATRDGLDGRIHWLGVRRDMPAIYAALDVLVSASLSEGFPNVVAEAGACGTPCVVTDVGDSAAIVQDRRFVVPPGAVDEMARAIDLALAVHADPGVFRQRVIGRFDRETSVLKTEALLQGLVAKCS